MDADFLLIRRIRQGDDCAIEQFVQKYYGDILNYCHYRCHDRAYAQDLTQETFIRFFTGLSGYRHSGKAKNYLYTIAGNLCKNFYKKNTEIPALDNEQQSLTVQKASGRPEEDPTEPIADRLAVRWALAQLPAELREVVILYYFQELKLKEIAAILKISLPLAKYRVRRARELLGELFREEGFYGAGKTAD